MNDQKIYCIVTPGKVGCHTIGHWLRRKKQVYNFHNLDRLAKLIKESNINKNWYIISGYREPISRNISYFFELMDQRFIGETREDWYIGSQKEIKQMSLEKIYTLFLEKNEKYLQSYEKWYQRLFDLLKLKDIIKLQNGLYMYRAQHGDKFNFLFYELEKLNENKDKISDFLDININDTKNSCYLSKNKWYNEIYIKFKDKYQNNFINK